MRLVLPDWVSYVVVGWGCFTVGAFCWALFTYFRVGYLEKQAAGKSTPWETSAFDSDVEVRWHDGRVESRLKPTKV